MYKSPNKGTFKFKYTDRPVRSLILKHTNNIDQYFQIQYEQQVKGHCRKYASPAYFNVLPHANNVKKCFNNDGS